MPDFGKALKQLRDRDRQPYLAGLNPVAKLSLSTQLQFLKSSPGTRRYVPVETRSREALPPGEARSTVLGSHYVVEKDYAGDYYHGKVRLNRFSTVDLQHLMALMKQRAVTCERDRIIFLDTETTGVQGGTGICPFLVGLGYFSGDEFHLVQFFIRDFDEEPSMLWELGNLLPKFDLLVTYNGASFDVPLLETRFRLARLENPFDEIAHFDLLHPARRLWRNGHGSCRLTALERLLSFVRGPDVPGAMIPRVYFDFLQERHSPELPGVFTHNAFDVISLAALTICACDSVIREPAPLDDPLDLYSLGRILENSADWRKAIHYYEMALKGGLAEPIRSKALENLSIIFRRTGEHQRSFEMCQELMRSEEVSIVAYEGAAIYYERIVGNLEKAVEVVHAGLRRIESGSSIPSKRLTNLLRARAQRLQQNYFSFCKS